jgi:hypothetical protein
MIFRGVIASVSEGSTKTQETLGENLISYMLETRVASDIILLYNVKYCSHGKSEHLTRYYWITDGDVYISF